MAREGVDDESFRGCGSNLSFGGGGSGGPLRELAKHAFANCCSTGAPLFIHLCGGKSERKKNGNLEEETHTHTHSTKNISAADTHNEGAFRLGIEYIGI